MVNATASAVANTSLLLCKQSNALQHVYCCSFSTPQICWCLALKRSTENYETRSIFDNNFEIVVSVYFTTPYQVFVDNFE